MLAKTEIVWPNKRPLAMMLEALKLPGRTDVVQVPDREHKHTQPTSKQCHRVCFLLWSSGIPRSSKIALLYVGPLPHTFGFSYDTRWILAMLWNIRVLRLLSWSKISRISPKPKDDTIIDSSLSLHLTLKMVIGEVKVTTAAGYP